MKITGIRNAILTPDFDETIKTFENLGFVKAHSKSEIGKLGNDETVLKSPCGDSIVVVGLKQSKQAFTATAINVDDIQEAVREFEAQGFTNLSQLQGTGSSTGTLLRSKEGYMVILSQHQ